MPNAGIHGTMKRAIQPSGPGTAEPGPESQKSHTSARSTPSAAMQIHFASLARTLADEPRE